MLGYSEENYGYYTSIIMGCSKPVAFVLENVCVTKCNRSFYLHMTDYITDFNTVMFKVQHIYSRTKTIVMQNVNQDKEE